jgi:arsenate reductase
MLHSGGRQGGMSDGVFNVLFLCTGNSARSILAEALLNRMGEGRFRAFSAGSFPKGQVHPMAVELLADLDFPVADLRSKSWDEFSGAEAPPLDFIFTVCDDAATETCPVWPGRPTTAHWGIEDPARVEGPGQREAFERAFHSLRQRIASFLALPLESLEGMKLGDRLAEIGRTDGATSR